MVPRLISIGLRLVLLIPFLIGFTRGISLDHDTAIAITPMTDQLSRRKHRSFGRIFRNLTVDRNHGVSVYPIQATVYEQHVEALEMVSFDPLDNPVCCGISGDMLKGNRNIFPVHQPLMTALWWPVEGHQE